VGLLPATAIRLIRPLHGFLLGKNGHSLPILPACSEPSQASPRCARSFLPVAPSRRAC
jgi:hypothetical protein